MKIRTFLKIAWSNKKNAVMPDKIKNVCEITDYIYLLSTAYYRILNTLHVSKTGFW
jgi:hypothetical protein